MFIKLNHKLLFVYGVVRELVKEIYRVSLLLPDKERYNMVPQVRRAALSVKLNLSEGCSRRSPGERKRYFEIARGSVIEIDAALETAVDLNFLPLKNLENTGEILNKCFAMLSKMMR